MTPMTAPATIRIKNLPLPHDIAGSPEAAAISRRAIPLVAGSTVEILRVDWAPQTRTALQSLYRKGWILRGFDAARDQLLREHKGHQALPHTPLRVCRALLVTSDASAGLCRQMERLLRQTFPRVIGGRLSIDGSTLGTLLFGPERLAKCVLITRKQGVVAWLAAVASQQLTPGDCSGRQSR